MNQLISGSPSLLSLPDISKWNTQNIKDMSNLFDGCLSLNHYLTYPNGILKM